MLYYISINGLLFLRNKVIWRKDFVIIGEGVFYSVEVFLIFWGNVIFISNSKFVLVLDGFIIEIYDNVYFYNNSGFRGGVLVMYGCLRIIFYRDFNFFF